MYALRQAVPRTDTLSILAGAALTVVAVLAMARAESVAPLALPLVALAFLFLLALWIEAPHVAAASTIPLFALIPAGKVLVTPWLGPVKDLVVLAAAGAVVNLHASRRRDAFVADRMLLVLVVAFLGLYALNVGGLASAEHHGMRWAQGARLVAEPLILLIAGATLARPRRTLDWACASMVATGCFVALSGIAQQVAGQGALTDLGFEYGAHVRTIGGTLRSFGTLDEPFSYAFVLMLALATVVFWMPPGRWAVIAGLVIGVGLTVSFVRGALIVSVALVALWLFRKRQAVVGLAVLTVAVLLALTFLLVDPSASETRSFQTGAGTYLTLNGRTDAWGTVINDRADLPFGRGVGAVGTAASRSGAGIIAVGDEQQEDASSVDSGYLAAVADVGLVGLGILLAILGRLVMLGVRGTRRPGETSWLVLAYLSVVTFDAATRSSFTAFPSAFIAFLLVGIGIAVLADEKRAVPALRRF